MLFVFSVFKSMCLSKRNYKMMLIIYHPSLWLIKPTSEHVDGEDIFEPYIYIGCKLTIETVKSEGGVT